MADDTPRGLFERFFRACLLILGGVVCVVIALTLIERIWGWLLLIAGIALVIWSALAAYRYWWRPR